MRRRGGRPGHGIKAPSHTDPSLVSWSSSPQVHVHGHGHWHEAEPAGGYDGSNLGSPRALGGGARAFRLKVPIIAIAGGGGPWRRRRRARHVARSERDAWRALRCPRSRLRARRTGYGPSSRRWPATPPPQAAVSHLVRQLARRTPGSSCFLLAPSLFFVLKTLVFIEKVCRRMALLLRRRL